LIHVFNRVKLPLPILELPSLLPGKPPALLRTESI
jgi:hypothetical protein